MISNLLHPKRSAIVLAGGDGKRLQPFIRQLLGYDLPKQYVNFIGTRSMLEHTYGRVESIAPPERIFTVVAQDHLKHPEVRRQLRQRISKTVIVQPVNRETGPGLLLPLMYLFKRHPNSTVAVFPSDHFILQEDLFLSHVEKAYEEVEKSPSKIVFLGIPPTNPESEYGYILPDYQEPETGQKSRRVKAFIEKPERELASRVVALGALWNTMVMVFRPEILLHLVSFASPLLYHIFQTIFKILDTPSESLSIERIYKRMPYVNLSKDLIESMDVHSRSQLSVIPMQGVFWSDWGSSDRILAGFNDMQCRNGLQKSSIPTPALHPIAVPSDTRMVAGLYFFRAHVSKFEIILSFRSFMIKVRPGITLPIIPEDLIDSDEDFPQSPGQIQSCMQKFMDYSQFTKKSPILNRELKQRCYYLPIHQVPIEGGPGELGTRLGRLRDQAAEQNRSNRKLHSTQRQSAKG